MILGESICGVFIISNQECNTKNIDLYKVYEEFNKKFESLYKDLIEQEFLKHDALKNFKFNMELNYCRDVDFDYEDLSFGFVSGYETSYTISELIAYNEVYKTVLQDLLNENSEKAQQLWSNSSFSFIKEKLKEPHEMRKMVSVYCG